MMAASLWSQFIERKIETAVLLDSGCCNGSYSDACVLLSALISGVAAELWPGEGIDRARFVELWVRYADSKLEPALVSVPLLRQQLRGEHREKDARVLETARPDMFGLGNSSLVLRGCDVDMTEVQVAQLLPALGAKDIRAFSYPVLFYKHVRSNLVHEFKL